MHVKDEFHKCINMCTIHTYIEDHIHGLTQKPTKKMLSHTSKTSLSSVKNAFHIDACSSNGTCACHDKH